MDAFAYSYLPYPLRVIYFHHFDDEQTEAGEKLGLAKVTPLSVTQTQPEFRAL